MGIYIKGMEMPKEDDEIIIRIDSSGTVMTEYALPISWAKAVPVPPHGRLIDADKLCLSSGFSTATEYGMGRSDQIEAIKSNAPTIIPASEEEMK